jgi:hypothetical protein
MDVFTENFRFDFFWTGDEALFYKTLSNMPLRHAPHQLGIGTHQYH